MTCTEHDNLYAAAAGEAISLNADNIRRCNSQSMYNAGNNIAAEAQSTYEKFFAMFPTKDDYTEQQRICKR